MSEEIKPGEFKTALMGFNKADVLAYIDRLSEEALEKQTAVDTRQESLEQELTELRDQHDILREKTQELCDRLKAEMKKAEDEEARASELEEQLLRAQGEGHTLTNRLFSQEQEIMQLKGENARLTERIETFKKEHEALAERTRQAEDGLAQKTEECEKLKEGQAEPEPQAKAEPPKPEPVKLTAEEVKTEEPAVHAVQPVQTVHPMQVRNSQEVAESVLRLREQLGTVDRKITEATSRLQAVTAAVEAALSAAEHDLDNLGAGLGEADCEAEATETEAVSEGPAEQAPKAEAEPKTAEPSAEPHRTQQTVKKTVSESILDLLERVLKQ